MTGPAARGCRPGRVVAASAGEAAADQFAGRGVAGGVQPGDAGRAIVAGDPDTAGTPHGPFREQGDLEHVRERVDAEAVEDQEEVGLALAHGTLDIWCGAVESRVHALGEQRPGDD